MHNFFTEQISETNNSEEGQKNIERFPDLDPVYVITASVPERKQYVNKLWKLFSPYADLDFVEESKRNGLFYKRTWEMYLGATLVKRDYKLIQKTPSGPDFKILHNDQIFWIEATAPGRGIIDMVPERPEIKLGLSYSGVHDIAEGNRPRIVRILGAIANKSEQYKKNLDYGVVSFDQPYIVAINGYGFGDLVDSEDLLVRWAFCGLGLLNITQGGRQFLAEVPVIEKRTEQGVVEIETGVFTSKKFEHISAVIFSSKHVINTTRGNLGSDLIFLRNNHARNPVPDDFWKIGREWIHDSENKMIRCVPHDPEAECRVY